MADPKGAPNGGTRGMGRGLAAILSSGAVSGRDEAPGLRELPTDLIFDSVIPRNVRVGEAPSYGVPVIRHDPRCSGSVAYLKLAKEVAARG